MTRARHARDRAGGPRSTVRAGVLTIAGFCVFLPGCGTAPALPVAEVTDSAGIRVVRYDLSVQEVAPWRVLAPHDLQIGVRDGSPEYALSGVTDLAVPDDGSIVLSDRVSAEIRVYDADGAWVRSLGGKGDGPGEFTDGPLIAGVAGDTVFAFDARSRRVTPYRTDGTLLEPLTFHSSEMDRPLAVERLDDGRFVAQSRWIPPIDPGLYDVRVDVDSVAITEHGPDALFLDSITVLEDVRQGRQVGQRPDGAFRVLQALTPYTARAFLETDGRRTLFAHGGRFDLLVCDGAMAPALRIVVDGVQHPASREDIRRKQEERIREDLGDGEIAPMVRLLNIEFAPEKLQAFVDARFSTSGDLWVALQDFEEVEGTDWLVFAPDGTLRGEVNTPETMRLQHVGDEYVVGVVTDEFDVPYVRRYPLVPPRSAGD